MNTLIITALSGVLMMFSGFMLKSKTSIRTMALVLLFAAIVINVLELKGIIIFDIDTNGMLDFDGGDGRFALLFTLVVNISTFVFFLLSARDMEKVGLN